MNKAKRTATYDGTSYKVRSDSIEIPNFAQMERIAVLVWLNRNTYGRGYSNKPVNLLQGMGGAIGLSVH